MFQNNFLSELYIKGLDAFRRNALWAFAQNFPLEPKPDLFSYATGMISRWNMKTVLS
jgi:hypothetical protein